VWCTRPAAETHLLFYTVASLGHNQTAISMFSSVKGGPAQRNESVQVVVRARPMNKKETVENRSKIVEVAADIGQVSLANPEKPHQPPKAFTFDAVYDETSQQRTFYDESCSPLVESVLEGFNGTVFAYGQTGCGTCINGM
jgi:kinesin family protein 3/17